MTQGILIAIEGTDGAGKNTLTTGLVRLAVENAISAVMTGFPRYHTPTGIAIKAYLHGALGNAQEVDPRIAAKLYEEDRIAAAEEIRAWLAEGEVVFSDRYKISNEAHQGTKIDDPAARQAFYLEQQHREYVLNGIPKPDLTVVLHVPAAVSMARVEKRGATKDGHENEDHTIKAERNYLELAKLLPAHIVVSCMDGDEPIGPDAVLARVWQGVAPAIAAHRIHA